MDKNERHLTVMEIKGLLDAIKKESSHARFQLSYDNLADIVLATGAIRLILDRIDAKVSPMIEEELMNDELF